MEVSKTVRLNYIDALRGFTILLVVYLHFINFSLDLKTEDSIITSVFVPIRMPLFFCISGFFAYCAFDKTLLRNRIKNRIFKQLWPTICIFFVFFLFYQMFEVGGLKAALLQNTKMGYWFTYSLVQVYLSFTLISISLHWLRFNRGGQCLAYSFVFICCISLNYIIWNYCNHSLHTTAAYFLSSMMTLRYAAWFYFGVILKLMFENLKQIMNKAFFFPIVLLFFIISYLHQDVYQTITGTMCSMSGILLVVSIFYYTRKFWDSRSWFARVMIMIGTATLPVYLFHYFFVHSIGRIPHIHGLSAIVGVHYLEIPIIMLFSIAIAGMCIGIDKGMNRYIPSVHNFIFHSKKSTPK